MARAGVGRALGFGAVLALAACAGPPDLNLPEGVTVAQIVDRVQCEVWQAAQKNPVLKRDKWVAVVDLLLQVDDSVGLTPSVAFIHPLSVVDGTSVAATAAGQLSGARLRIFTETLTLQVNNVKERACYPRGDRGIDLTGDLGIIEAVDLAVGSVDRNSAAQFAEKDAFGQTIQFVLTKNVSNVGPTWTLTHFIGPGGLFGAERVDTHKLVISFAPGVKRKAAPGAARIPAIDRARLLNQNMLLQSLPILRPSAR